MISDNQKSFWNKPLELGSTNRVRLADLLIEWLLVRQDDSRPQFPTMLTVQTSPLEIRHARELIAFALPPQVQIEIITTPVPGSWLVLDMASSDAPRVTAMLMTETSAYNWLQTNQPDWLDNGDYSATPCRGPNHSD